jgi:hypothetical protein
MHHAYELTYTSPLSRHLPDGWKVKRTAMKKGGEHFYYATRPNGEPVYPLGKSYREAREAIKHL